MTICQYRNVAHILTSNLMRLKVKVISVSWETINLTLSAYNLSEEIPPNYFNSFGVLIYYIPVNICATLW